MSDTYGSRMHKTDKLTFYYYIKHNKKSLDIPKGQSIYKCLVDNIFHIDRIEQQTLWVRIQLRRGVLDTPLCDKVCQWFAASLWFFSRYIGFLHQWNWQSSTHSLDFFFHCANVSVQIAKLKPKNIYDRSVGFSGYSGFLHNNLQNTTQNTKDWATRTPLKTGGGGSGSW